MRDVVLADGDRSFFSLTDPFAGVPASLSVYDLPSDLAGRACVARGGVLVPRIADAVACAAAAVITMGLITLAVPPHFACSVATAAVLLMRSGGHAHAGHHAHGAAQDGRVFVRPVAACEQGHHGWLHGRLHSGVRSRGAPTLLPRDCPAFSGCSTDGGAARRCPCHVLCLQSGEQVQKVAAHSDRVMCMAYDKHRIMFATASRDFTAKLFDLKTMDVLRVIETDRPVNAIAISPIMHHVRACVGGGAGTCRPLTGRPSPPQVMLGGGQEAITVTTTAARAGKFEVRFFNTVFTEEFGRVKGHFGPINTLAFHPDGTRFVRARPGPPPLPTLTRRARAAL